MLSQLRMDVSASLAFYLLSYSLSVLRWCWFSSPRVLQFLAEYKSLLAVGAYSDCECDLAIISAKDFWVFSLE